MSVIQAFLRSTLILSLLAFAIDTPAQAADAPVNPKQTWQLLDYIAVDYAGAVKDGQVISAGEFAEMQEFSATVVTQLTALPATPQQADLIVSAKKLNAAVESHKDPTEVAAAAHLLASQLLASYPIDANPASTPDLARGAALYAQQCTACHGTTGHADGPIAASLDPPPIAFADPARAAQRSPFALYQVITQGLSGTSMASFSSLSEPDRWALAYYASGLAYSPQARAEGEIIWKNDAALRQRIPSLEALTHSSEADLRTSLANDQANAITAFLRANPQAFNTAPTGQKSGTFSLARQRLTDSLNAFKAGDQSGAKTLALSAYLDGVEPSEPTLAARDPELLREVETVMGEFRAQIANNAAPEALALQATKINAVLDRAEVVLGNSESDFSTAFFGSFTILLREGLEALLIVIGMIAFLRKAERRDVLPYVHAGWVGALLAGVVTWGVATYLVGISGANREVTEGLSALFAAAVLLSVGIWMHQKSLAGRWQQYLNQKMSAALTKRSALFLFSLAFIAVYREVFETILFFIAMWSEHNGAAILAGLVAGSAALAAVAYWMLRMSKRLPIGQFFSISSLLIAVLAVVLVGKGIAALQEAGWISQAVIAFPRIDWLGIYPSWQSLLSQVAVAIAATLGFVFNMRSSKAVA